MKYQVLFSEDSHEISNLIFSENVGGLVVRWCWVSFQCRGVLRIWIIVGQGSTALAVDAVGGCLDIFSLVYHFSLLSPSLGDGPI